MKKIFSTLLLITIVVGAVLLHTYGFFRAEDASVRLRAHSEGNVRLSVDKLEFNYGWIGSDDALCIADKSYTKGKYYFEFEYQCKRCNTPPIAPVDLGLIDINSRKLYIPPTHDREPYFYGLPTLENYPQDGYVLGVAADLDNGKIYFRINGVWINCYDYRRSIAKNGNPEMPEAGLPINTGVEYAAAAFIAPYGREDKKPSLKANFGHKPFRHEIPRGFTSYDGSQNGKPPRKMLNPVKVITYPQQITGEDGSLLHAVIAVNAFSKNELNKCRVKVTKQNRPLSLALVSDNRVHWMIEVETGADITKIYAFTSDNSPHKISGIDSKIQVIQQTSTHFKNLALLRSKYEHEQFARINMLTFIKHLELNTGIQPATIQSEQKSWTFMVDGVQSLKTDWIVYDAPIYNAPIVLNPSTPCCAQLSDDRLIIAHNGERNPNIKGVEKLSPARARASVHYNTGKRYLEFTYMAGEKGGKRDLKTEVGILEDLSVRPTFGNAGIAGKSYGLIGKRPLIDGQTIGVAIDYDNWRLRHTFSGHFSKFGQHIEPYRNYLPAASVAYPGEGKESDMWIVNFGKRPFKYKMPEGFKPYDETIKDQ